MPERALEGISIVECGHLASAAYATKLMADMGAEVIKIEEPTGDQARQRGPYPGHVPHPEKSGLFLYLNTNKYGVTLNLTHPRGQDVFHRLLKDADLLVHNYHPTEMARHGLDYNALAKVNPSLVMTSIAPFGLSGPHKDYQATDLTLWNAGGIAYLNGGGPGTDDMPPLKTFGQQSGYQAGVNAAIASLGALFGRLTTKEGQHIEVSTQESLLSILELTFEFFPYMGVVASRVGQKPIQPLDFLECKDGWVFLCCVEEHQWKNFVDLMGSPEWVNEPIFADRFEPWCKLGCPRAALTRLGERSNSHGVVPSLPIASRSHCPCLDDGRFVCQRASESARVLRHNYPSRDWPPAVPWCAV
jgi:crotonobetainyl-CoA:carnitine CoA-transferase CaiB-like acyl-CoA transferase